MKTSNPALLVIDVQKGIDESDHWGGNRNNPEAEQNIKLLIGHWRLKEWPVIFVKHDSVFEQSPFRPGQHGNELRDFIKRENEDVLIKKSATNAFINTPLKDELLRKKIQEIVIVGFVTNNSVEATARMAGDLGYSTFVVSDATACFDKIGLNQVTYSSELIHLISLSNLDGEYARVLSTKEILTLSL